jgi:hypothetical protein
MKNEVGQQLRFTALRNFLCQLIGSAADEDWVRDAVVSDERFEARRVRFRIAGFKIDVHNLQPTRVKLLVEADQKRRLIMAVRAPRTADRDDHHLAAKFRIGIGDRLSAKVWKGECEGFAGILDRCLLRRIRRSREDFLCAHRLDAAQSDRRGRDHAANRAGS